MAENKQYVTQAQNNGTVNISEDVIAAVVAHAATEVAGVAGLASRPGSDITGMIGRKTTAKGVKVTVLDDNSVAIECNINILYGQSVVNVANAAQDAIIGELESMAGVSLAAVNVNVCGIVRQ